MNGFESQANDVPRSSVELASASKKLSDGAGYVLISTHGPLSRICKLQTAFSRQMLANKSNARHAAERPMQPSVGSVESQPSR